MTTLLVIAKEPRAGRVKTRLTPPFTPGQAAELAEAALADTLHAVAATPASRRVLVLDGAPGPWLPPGFDVVPQCAGGLDERLADAFARCDGPALLIGMDTPQVTPELLTVDFTDCDAHFGPAEDGGFWALGLARPDPALLRGVPMSTPGTGAAQRNRLLTAGLRVRDLPPLRDVDTAADAHAVAALAPHGRFAARLARCTGVAGPDARPVTGVDSSPGTRGGSPPGTEPDSGPDSPPNGRPNSPPGP
ncbi:TIGR04282 family arsenosugar biosynthesis glycosyltransferase [Streptomyces sp. P9-A2]|uniref:TIGR04282 family arsenosugar biosynthesis glycosyltransferase n=1 Tax=Streptomyces sp. P9-A2 TaxID=3072284 RepID=UPI002FCAA74C